LRAGESMPAGPDLTSERAEPPAVADPQPSEAGSRGRPGGRAWWIAGAWTAGLLIVFAFFIRIGQTLPINSDGANNALQAWDMVHGNILLHHWVIGDATYYTFDLPVLAIAEAFLGMDAVAVHVAMATMFLVVAVLALVIARIGSRGAATAVRCGVVVAVLTAGFADGFIFLLKPDHAATSAFLLACFLLIDRAPARWFTPPALLVILCAGQIGDGLVLYVAVPAISLVSFYRWVASRGARWSDLAITAAALLSVPAALLVRALMVRLGGYAMAPPDTAPAPISLLGEHLRLIWENIRVLFGVIPNPSPLGAAGAPFGTLCLLAAAFGFGKVVWNWRRASWAEQLLCVAIVVTIAAYAFSRLPSVANPHEIAPIVPCGAILAARALVPAAIKGTWRARIAIVTAAAAALLPLSVAADRPLYTTPSSARLVEFLKAHGLQYGIAGYWNASLLTFLSRDQIQVRAVQPYHHKLAVLEWETDNTWYDAWRHDATFVLVGRSSRATTTSKTARREFERYLGKPVATYHVDGWLILVYHRNLLRSVVPGPLGPA
jgi:hypothetical protein